MQTHVSAFVRQDLRLVVLIPSPIFPPPVNANLCDPQLAVLVWMAPLIGKSHFLTTALIEHMLTQHRPPQVRAAAAATSSANDGGNPTPESTE